MIVGKATMVVAALAILFEWFGADAQATGLGYSQKGTNGRVL
jgi:hypothetical protein